MGWQDRDYASYNTGRGTGGFGLYSASRGSRFSDNPLNWSPKIGRLFGIRIRVHITFILFLGFELLGRGGFGWNFKWLVLLFGSVLLHEFGHCFAARRVGGTADDILMWPLGGLASVDTPRQPWPSFVTVVWGPLVNVILFVAAGAVLLASGATLTVGDLNPFSWFLLPADMGEFHVLVMMFFAVNMLLFQFNLFPMYPMDGGRMLHCIVWRYKGYRQATLIASTVGMVAAVAMGLYALVATQYILLAIAFMGYLTCHQERTLVKAGMYDEGPVDYETLSYGGHGSYGRPKRPGIITRMRQRAALRRQQEARRRAETQQQQVDAILDKVHREGIGSLSGREKRILEQASRDGRG